MREPETGTIADGVHLMPMRVYYEDTDAGGIVYHANYLRLAERARAEVLRLLGFGTGVMRDRFGMAFVVRRAIVDYIAPARLDDALEIVTRILEAGAASMRAAQHIRRAGTDLVRIEVQIACIRSDGRPARLPSDLRAALAPLLPAGA